MASQEEDKAECRTFKDIEGHRALIKETAGYWVSIEDRSVAQLFAFVTALEPLIVTSGYKFIAPLLKENLVHTLRFLYGKGEDWRRNLMEALDKAFKENQWDDFANLDIIEIDPMHVTSQPSKVEHASLSATVGSWTEPYRGRSHKFLWKHISNFYMKSEGSELYENMCTIVQSSGMGKSRAVNEFGKTHFLIPINLRKAKSGYPPPDVEIRDYLTEDLYVSDQARGRCFLFLFGLFSQTLEGLQRAREMKAVTTKQDMILWFHEQMAPPEKNEFRTRFWKDVLNIAMRHGDASILKKGAEPLEGLAAAGGATVDVRSTRGKVTLNSMLVAAAQALVDFLRGAGPEAKEGEPDEVEVVLAFDEAHVLCEKTRCDIRSGGQVWSMFDMLRQALRCLYGIPVWGLFLSTTGKLSQFSPHHGIDPSMRIRDEQFKSVPAFTTLRNDLFAPRITRTKDGTLWISSKVSNDSQSRPKKKAKVVVKGKILTLDRVTKTRFLVKFGRPLFYLIWHHGDAVVRSDIIRFAMSKLICEDPTHLTTTWKSAVPVDVAFACLSQRLCIEFNSSKYNTDEETQIASHMRLCLKIDPDNQFIVSSSGSEPVLAEAAATIMQLDTFKAAESLKHVISGFGISKGDRGELVGLLAMTRARDLAVKKKIKDLNLSDTPGVLPVEVEESRPMFRAVKVMEFLEQLFSLKKLEKSALAGLEEDFKDAYVYFNHFVRPFDRSTCTLRHLMQYMTRGAAVLCSMNMPGIDALTGMLFESPDGFVFREDLMSGIFAQFKNDGTITEKRDRKPIERSIGHVARAVMKGVRDPMPIIRITFALGSKEALSYSKSSITLGNKRSVTTHDFWCGGIGDHLLPNDSESKDSWKALLSATIKWKGLFRDKDARFKGFGQERMCLAPGGLDKPEFWEWIQETNDTMVEDEDEEIISGKSHSGVPKTRSVEQVQEDESGEVKAAATEAPKARATRSKRKR